VSAVFGRVVGHPGTRRRRRRPGPASSRPAPPRLGGRRLAGLESAAWPPAPQRGV